MPRCCNAGTGKGWHRIEMPGGRGMRWPRPKLGCSAIGAGSLVVTLVPLGLTIKNSTFCSHSALMSSVQISDKACLLPYTALTDWCL